MTYTADIRILGGLPVTVDFNIQPAEPDVGICSSYIEEWYVTHIHGRKCKRADWIYDRIAKIKGEEDRIIQDLWDSKCEDDYYGRNY